MTQLGPNKFLNCSYENSIVHMYRRSYSSFFFFPLHIVCLIWSYFSFYTLFTFIFFANWCIFVVSAFQRLFNNLQGKKKLNKILNQKFINFFYNNKVLTKQISNFTFDQDHLVYVNSDRYIIIYCNAVFTSA